MIIGLTFILFLSRLSKAQAMSERCKCTSNSVNASPGGTWWNITTNSEANAKASIMATCTYTPGTCSKPECYCPVTCSVILDCYRVGIDYRCDSLCFSELWGYCEKKGGGKCDPHMSGFDGSKFNFDGRNGESYVIYGRIGGDLLVSEMRKDDKKHHTYFNKFGLQVPGSNAKFEVFLKNEDCTDNRKYCPTVLHNGFPILPQSQKRLAEKGVNVEAYGNTISISTPETSYKFLARLVGDDRRYLNVEVKPFSPSTTEQYLGVLGITLNRHVGHEISNIFDERIRRVFKKRPRQDAAFTKALEKKFHVSELFPERDEKLHSMHAIEKMSVSDKFFPISSASIDPVEKENMV